MNYEITALKSGEQLAPGPEIFYMNKWDEWVKIFAYIWLIRGEGKTILIDTGLRDVEELNPGIVSLLGEKAKFKMGTGEDIVSLLNKFKVKPKDVDYVILTHLHYDHISNLKLFSRAKIILSKKGWISVLAPKHSVLVPPIVFPRDIFAYLIDEGRDRVYLAEEEDNVLPGIKVFWVGGHSMCSQAIAVETKRGKVIFTGDTVFLYENIEKNIPIGLNYSLVECLDAMDRIRKEADIILPAHDPEILERYPGGRVI